MMYLTRILFLLYITTFSECSLHTSIKATAGNLTEKKDEFEIDDDNQNMVSSFPCQKFEVPDRDITVHTLSPKDVGVVGAIGDSITAAFGATAVNPFAFKEERGLSFSMGGDGTIEEMITLPNILRMYNPNLKGFSVGDGAYNSVNAHFNVAQVGAVSNMILAQTSDLIKRMKSDDGIDFENDWKVITIFIGGNDICNYCVNERVSARKFVMNIKASLDLLHRRVPKAFVNVIELIDLLQFQTLDDVKRCNTAHHLFCSCVTDAITPELRGDVRKLSQQFQQGLRDLIASGRYDTSKDFTVVLQPFLTETKLRESEDAPLPVREYLAFDCFHLSKEGHMLAAKSLWSNMNQPVGHKRRILSVEVECPSANHPFFYTTKNSGPLTKWSVFSKATARFGKENLKRLQHREQSILSKETVRHEAEKLKTAGTESENMIDQENVEQSVLSKEAAGFEAEKMIDQENVEEIVLTKESENMIDQENVEERVLSKETIGFEAEKMIDQENVEQRVLSKETIGFEVKNLNDQKKQEEITELKNSKNFGSYITVAIGGVVVVAALATISLYYMRKQSKNKESTYLLVDPKYQSF